MQSDVVARAGLTQPYYSSLETGAILQPRDDKLLALDTAFELEPGTVYSLNRTSSGWKCSCSGYGYTGVCKHLAQVERRSEREGWRFGKIAPRIVA